MLGQGKSVKQKRTRQQRTRIAWTIVRAAAIIVATGAAAIFFWQALTQPGTPATALNNGAAALAYSNGYAQLRLGTAEGFSNATIEFARAKKAEPRSVPPSAGLFEATLMDVNIEASFTDEKIRRLNELADDLAGIAPNSTETHAAKAIMLWLNERNPGKGESEFKQALEADPDSRMALTCYGYFLTRLGRSNAPKVLEHALVLDQTSPLILNLLGNRRNREVFPSDGTTAPSRTNAATIK